MRYQYSYVAIYNSVSIFLRDDLLYICKITEQIFEENGIRLLYLPFLWFDWGQGCVDFILNGGEGGRGVKKHTNIYLRFFMFFLVKNTQIAF